MQKDAFLAFANRLPEALILIEKNGEIIAVNAHASKLLNISTSPLPKSITNLVEPESSSNIASLLKPASRVTYPLPLPISWNKPNIQTFGFLFSPPTSGTSAQLLLRIEKKHSNEHFSVLNEAVDVQKQALRKLQKSQSDLLTQESLFHAIFNNNNAVIYIKDIQGKYLRINHRYESLFNITNAEIKGKTDFDVFPMEIASAFKLADEKVISIQEPMELEEYAPHPDGIHTYASVKFPLFDSNNKLYAIGGIATDITDRVKAEKSLDRLLSTKLSDADAYNRTIFKHSPVGFALNDLSGTLIDVNQAFLDIIQYSEEEAKNLTYWEITPKSYEQEEQEQLRQLTENGRYGPYEKHYISSDGSLVPVRLNGFTIEKNGTTYVWSVVENIAEQKRHEEALILARNNAEETAAEKGHFLANMSHEIRTPMNAIIGMSELALATSLDDKQRNYIEKAHAAAHGLLTIINDILDFSKVEANQLQLEHVNFNLAEVLNELSSIVCLTAKDKNIELLFDVAHNVPLKLIGDSTRLRQILLNLTNNALKFTQINGDVVIKIGRANNYDSTGNLIFSVSDTGIGITEEQQKTLFHSFSQADITTTREYGGTGLGLAICKQITELMNGSIWVESALGTGSTFFVSIAFDKQESTVCSLPKSGLENDRKRVLLLDSHTTSNAIIARMLSDINCSVVTATNISAFVDALKQTTPTSSFDFIFINLRTPAQTELEVCKRAAENVSSCPIPIILITSVYAIDDARKACVGIDVANYIEKPVLEDSLRNSIAKISNQAIKPPLSLKNTKPSNSHPSFDGINVLLVEDNELNQELAIEVLTTKGIKVALAENGQQALDILEKQQFNVILMDIQMPIMDGYTAAKFITNDPRFSETPIIAMTAGAMINDKQKAIDAGMVDYISKPFNISALFSTLSQWVHTKKDSIADTPRTSTDNSSSVELPVISGLDTSQGLRTTNNDVELYLRLLQMFQQQYDNFPVKFSESLSDSDGDAAMRLAHSLSGTAGNIGATKIQQYAKALELSCNQSPNISIDDASEVSEALSILMSELRRFNNHQKITHVNRKPHNNTRLDTLMAKLSASLAANSFEALATAKELQTLNPSQELAKLIEDLLIVLEQFDFESAIKIMNTYKQ